MKLSALQERQLKEFAPYQNEQHLFFVKNQYYDNSHWAPVTGACIDAIITGGTHQVVYIGEQRHCPPRDKDGKITEAVTPAQKEFMKKFRKYAKLQLEDLAEMKRITNEALGIYETVSEPPLDEEGQN
jgi:hypothetical protein